MRVCYLGWYERTYPRNELLRRGLELAGVEVVECRVPQRLAPGHGSPPPLRAPAPAGTSRWRSLPAALRGPLARARYELHELALAGARVAWLVREFRRQRRGLSAVVLAEFNQGLAPLAWLLARGARVPLVVDFFVSLYDTAVLDRGLLRPDRPRARWRMLSDKAALRLADRFLIDTWQHGEHYRAQLDADLSRARLIPIGAPERDCHPTPLPERAPGRPLTVLYFGSYIPFHGVEHVIAAARQLRDDPRFRFVLVGDGQTLAANRADYAADPSGNLGFRGWVAQEEVPALIAEADVCLGVFGTQPKTQRVITNKVWQCLASGRPVITADGPAPRSVTEDGRHCLLVPPGDTDAIVAALRTLAGEPDHAQELSKLAAELVREEYSTAPLGRQLATVIAEVAR